MTSRCYYLMIYQSFLRYVIVDTSGLFGFMISDLIKINYTITAIPLLAKSWLNMASFTFMVL